jgi:hypothetical protein
MLCQAPHYRCTRRRSCTRRLFGRAIATRPTATVVRTTGKSGFATRTAIPSSGPARTDQQTETGNPDDSGVVVLNEDVGLRQADDLLPRTARCFGSPCVSHLCGFYLRARSDGSPPRCNGPGGMRNRTDRIARSPSRCLECCRERAWCGSWGVHRVSSRFEPCCAAASSGGKERSHRRSRGVAVGSGRSVASLNDARGACLHVMVTGAAPPVGRGTT